MWNGWLSAATWIVLGQAVLQGWRAFQDLHGPRDARGWVSAEHMWAFLALAIVFLCLTEAYRRSLSN